MSRKGGGGAPRAAGSRESLLRRSLAGRSRVHQPPLGVLALELGALVRLLHILRRESARSSLNNRERRWPARTVLCVASSLAKVARARTNSLFARSARCKPPCCTTTGGRAGGAGLGLAISRDLVRAHGGDITLAETGASGTVFRFTLPQGAG